jgi:signal transduction histidine kinase
MDGVDPSGRLPFPRRYFTFFLVAFLVPVAILTALAIRTLNQERELAVRREDDERGQLANATRQELLRHLDSLRLRTLARPVDEPGERREPDAGDAIALVATVDDSRLVLPWENRTPGADSRRILSEQPFAELISRGESEELIHHRPRTAAILYRRALSKARHPIQTASAELLVARALARNGRHAESLSYTRLTLARSLSLVDEQGIPLALYASRRVAGLQNPTIGDARAALKLAHEASMVPSASPAAVHMAAAVVSTLGANQSAEIQSLASAVQPALADRIAHREQALALQQTFPALLRQFSTTALGGDPLWLPFGQRLWLVTVATDITGRQPLLLAVDATNAFARVESVTACVALGGCRLGLTSSAGTHDYPLGAALPGLVLIDVRSSATGEPRRSLANQPFYVAALSLVLTLAAFSAFLLWRDVRRELRVAQLRSEFVASVSHELKTPLTAIRMFAETLRMRQPVDPAVRDEYLDTIVNESERLTRLLNNVLDFSRIESGRKVYQFAPCDLSMIVRTAARAMHYPLERQGFELLVEIADGLPPVLADADALEQAVLNLLSNALKYSGEARRIELRLSRDGAYGVISVRDWGIGIEPRDTDRIFDKFYRVVPTEHRQIPGTGLGLTLVDHVARAHHGFVRVESTPGEGSLFRMHLPLDLKRPASAFEENGEPVLRTMAVNRPVGASHRWPAS